MSPSNSTSKKTEGSCALECSTTTRWKKWTACWPPCAKFWPHDCDRIPPRGDRHPRNSGKNRVGRGALACPAGRSPAPLAGSRSHLAVAGGGRTKHTPCTHAVTLSSSPELLYIASLRHQNHASHPHEKPVLDDSRHLAEGSTHCRRVW